MTKQGVITSITGRASPKRRSTTEKYNTLNTWTRRLWLLDLREVREEGVFCGSKTGLEA
jgi:hypothetical protein